MITRSAIRKLTKAVVRLQEQLPRAELLPRDVLDILWLARVMGPEPKVPEPVVVEPAAAALATTSHVPEVTAKTPPRTPLSVSPRRPPSMRPQPEQVSAEANLHSASTRDKTAAGIPAKPLRAPGASTVRDTLPISRSLLPLRKRVGSRSTFVFDEVATAEQFAESRILEPVFRPTPAGWLDLALVAHVSGSMHFWWQTVEELRVVLERHSAFRHVRSWRLVDDEDGSLSLRAWSVKAQAVQQKELLTSGGRLLIVIVTDCMSPAWSDQRMADLLNGWLANGPISVFQVLPQDLWPRTEMRRLRVTTVRATEPGALNTQLISSVPSREDSIIVPVTALDRTTLTAWARVIAGAGGTAARGMMLPLTVEESVREARAEQIAAIENAPADERVARFDQTASEDARELARLFAAAPFPLTTEIMRMVQQAILPGSPPSAVAEVLLSGFMKHVPAKPGEDPDVTRYGFADEEVREHLLRTATAFDLLQVIRLLVTRMETFAGARIGTVVDFGALIADSSATGEHVIPADDEPFARVGVDVLRRLGGEYRKIADQIAVAIEGAKREEAPRTRTLLTGRRLALEERLRIVTVNESADGFVRSLYEWGLPVVVLAALAAARYVTPENDWKGREILQLADDALNQQTTDAANRIRERIGTDARLDATPVEHAARAAAIAFFRNEPPRNGTIEAATKCVLAAVDGLLGDHRAVVSAMVEALHDDVQSESSVVSEALPLRAWILVAGSGDVAGLPAEVALTAAALGTELASNGFRLLSGGWGGVDWVTSLAFAIEVELRGGEIESRLRHLHEGDRPDFDYGSKRRVTGDWIEQALGGQGIDARVQAVVTLGGSGSVAELIRRADQYRIPALPLPWTGGASSAAATRDRVFFFGRRGIFGNRAVSTAADADILVRRIVRVLSTVTDETLRVQWIEYTNTVYTVLRGAAESPLEQRAPRLNYWLNALAHDGAQVVPREPDELLETLERFASFFPHWLVDDFVEMTEFEPDGFGGQPDVVEQFARLAAAHASDLAFERLEQRFRALASPLPSDPIDFLPAAGRAFFGGYDEFNAWAKTFIGMDAPECFFRASIPFETFTLAERYIQHEPTLEAERYSDQIRHALVNLAPRREYVRRFIDQKSEAARVLGYIFMHLFDLGIGPIELASRIETEARECRYGTRPFRQLMEATKTIVGRYDMTASRIVARSLVEAEEVIAQQPPSFLHRDLQTRINALLRNQLDEANASNAVINDEAGRYVRNRKIRTTMDKMPPPLRRMSFSAAEVEYLFSHGSYDQRFLALRLAPETHGRTPFECIRQALLRPLDNHEAMLAVIAADRVAERLTHSQLVILIELVEATLGLFTEDAKLSKYLHEVLERLLRRRDSANRVRFAPIAVIGSDPTGAAFRDFVRDLGERLAMNELGVVTANAMFGVWLWEGYRRRIADAESFVVLRPASDERALTESLPNFTVEGDLAQLRNELVSRARGVILIGGGPGAYLEYRLARKHGRPVVAIAAAGRAAANVAAATLARLEAVNIAVDALREKRLTTRLAAGAASAMTQAVLAAEALSDASLEPRRHAASLDSRALVDWVGKRTSASRRTLASARQLLDAIKEGEIRWTRRADVLRRIDGYVQSLRPEFATDMYVAELVTRCGYVYSLIELSTVDALRKQIKAVAEYDRLSVVPDAVVHELMRAIEAAVIEEGPVREAAKRLREQLKERIIST